MNTTERILDLIKQKGISDYALKKETGLKNSVLSDLKAARAKNPSVETLKIIAKYFDVSVDYLLCLTDCPVPVNRLIEKLESHGIDINQKNES